MWGQNSMNFNDIQRLLGVRYGQVLFQFSGHISHHSSWPRSKNHGENHVFLFPIASERRVLPIVGVCLSSSHLHTFSSSHLLIFTPSLTPSHLHTFSSSHLPSHLLIFTSAHLHIFSSSHLLIFTPSHLHICSSSHLLLFTPSLTPSHLHTFLSSHLLIFTSSLSLTLSPLSSVLSLSPFSLSFLSLFSLSPSLSFSL